MKSQIAAIFGTSIITLIPATQFSGMIDPVSSLEGIGKWIGIFIRLLTFLLSLEERFQKDFNLFDLPWSFLFRYLSRSPLCDWAECLFLEKAGGLNVAYRTKIFLI